MKIHEYQARELLAKSGVTFLPSEIARSADEAQAAFSRLGGPCVVKAQVYAGGRGKAGFVKLVD